MRCRRIGCQKDYLIPSVSGSCFCELEDGGHVLRPLEDSGVQLDVLGGEEGAVQKEENSLSGDGNLFHQCR